MPLLQEQTALSNPKMSIVSQKRHPYTGILNSEMSGDSKNVFLHCGDVSATSTLLVTRSITHQW